MRTELKRAREIGFEAGRMARMMKDSINIDKTDSSNISTNADDEISNFYVRELIKVYNAPVITEENIKNTTPQHTGTYWLVDSIDGTLSYIEGFSSYVTQFALIENERPTYGFVYAPELDECFEGYSGLGATLNGTPIRVRKNTLTTIIDNSPCPNDFVKEIMSQLRIFEYVESGSIGLKICRVAQGAVSIFAKQTKIKSWDVAPAAVIISEAGGYVTDVKNRHIEFRLDTDIMGLTATNTQDRLVHKVISKAAEKWKLYDY